MREDAPTTPVGGRRQSVVRSEAERQALMAEYERWDGTQIGFCEARGVAPRTLMDWFRKRRPAAAAPTVEPASFVEVAAGSGRGWDVELSLGDGVVLRVRRS